MFTRSLLAGVNELQIRRANVAATNKAEYSDSRILGDWTKRGASPRWQRRPLRSAHRLGAGRARDTTLSRIGHRHTYRSLSFTNPPQRHASRFVFNDVSYLPCFYDCRHSLMRVVIGLLFAETEPDMSTLAGTWNLHQQALNFL